MVYCTVQILETHAGDGLKIKTREQDNKKRFVIHKVTIFLCDYYIFCLHFGKLLALYNVTRIAKLAIESDPNDDLLFRDRFT